MPVSTPTSTLIARALGDVVGKVACGGAAGQAQQQMAFVNKDGGCFASSIEPTGSPGNGGNVTRQL